MNVLLFQMKIYKIMSGKMVNKKKYVKTKQNIFVLDVGCIIVNFAIRGAIKKKWLLSYRKKNLFNFLIFDR